MRIIPSILTSNSDELLRQIDYIQEFTDEVDIDIMDGIMVPAKSVEIKNLPVKTNLNYNFDLMVASPKEYINQILEIKAKGICVNRVFVHSEANFDMKEIIDQSLNNFSLGFSLSLQTSIENLIDAVKKYSDCTNGNTPPVQIYTVELGKQGNPYHPEALNKILQLRKSGYNGDIYIDGGVDTDVVVSLRQYDICGVSVGSFISKSANPLKSFNLLKDATWKKDLD